jgi:hypothetical protein
VKVKQRSVREQQLVGKQARIGRTHGSLAFFALILPIWLLVWALTYFSIPAPDAGPFASFLFEARAPEEAFDPVPAKWWVLWGFATGLSLSAVLYGWALIGVRRVVRFALPMAPAAAGAPPRCRGCGAELPPSGPVRRCGFCGVDHVVMGEQYQRFEATLEGALGQMETRLEVSLADRVGKAGRAVVLAGTLPILLAVLSPAGLFLGGTRPTLWAVPACLFLLGMALFFTASRIPVPEVRTLEEVRAGDEILVYGRPSAVRAVFDLHPNSPLSGTVAILDGPTRALCFGRGADDRFEALLFRLAPGGEPWPDTTDTRDLFPVTIWSPAASPWSEYEDLSSVARLQGPGGTLRDLRLWVSKTVPRPGDPPDWTLSSPQPVKESRLVLSPKEPVGGDVIR